MAARLLLFIKSGPLVDRGESIAADKFLLRVHIKWMFLPRVHSTNHVGTSLKCRFWVSWSGAAEPESLCHWTLHHTWKSEALRPIPSPCSACNKTPTCKELPPAHVKYCLVCVIKKTQARRINWFWLSEREGEREGRKEGEEGREGKTMLSEKSQLQKTTHCTITFIWNVQNKQLYRQKVG